MMLEEDCREVVQALRGQLIELYAATNLDPGQPQEVARRLGLNKNLTWKVSKIINAADGLSAIPHVPGASGMEILLTGLESAGAPRRNLDAVHQALERFDQVVERHAGDRAQLDLMLDSMGLGANGAPLLASRQLAFQGNSGLWGVQARTRITTAFLVPNATDASLLDSALVGGFVGFRRLRPAAHWPLFRFMSYKHAGGAGWADSVEFPSAHEPHDPPRLLRRFCSASMPEIVTRVNGPATEYLLPAGPVGNLGAFDCFFGEIVRGAPRYRTESDPYWEFTSTITLPIETLVFDLIVHESVELSPPEVRVYGRPMGGPYDPARIDETSALPLAETCVELAGRPPAVATPLVPRYSDLVHAVMKDLGHGPSAFRGLRLLLRWPPMTSTVVLRSPLPERR
jgi:hypothetical protein